jgi:hypothetical protein
MRDRNPNPDCNCVLLSGIQKKRSTAGTSCSTRICQHSSYDGLGGEKKHHFFVISRTSSSIQYEAVLMPTIWDHRTYLSDDKIETTLRTKRYAKKIKEPEHHPNPNHVTTDGRERKEQGHRSRAIFSRRRKNRTQATDKTSR